MFGDAAYLRQCDKVAKQLGIALETITVSEARRRAKKADNVRNEARQYAVERHSVRPNPVQGLRAWARAFHRAAPVDDVVHYPGQSELLAAVSHHSAIQAPGAKLGQVETLVGSVLPKTSAQIEMEAAAVRVGSQDR